MNKVIEAVLLGIGLLVVLAGLGLLLAWPLMLMANYLFSAAFLTYVFGAPVLTFWKAYWLSVFLSWTVKSTSTSSSK